MLTVEENQGNVRALKILSHLNLLPIQIHGKPGSTSGSVQVENQRNRLKLWIWRILFSLGILHCLFIFGRLLDSILQLKYLKTEDRINHFRWDHFVIHYIMIVGFSILYVCGYLLFFVHPTDVVIIINYVFRQQENENDDGSGEISMSKENDEARWAKKVDRNEEGLQQRKLRKNSTNIRPLFKWPLEYSLQELLALTLFEVFGATGLFVVLVLGIDPTRPQLLYTILPEAYKNWISFLILLGLEGVFYVVVTSLGHTCILIQLEFLDKCEQKCERIQNCLRCLMNFVDRKSATENLQPTSSRNQNPSRSQPLHRILKQMKELELCIELFNRCFPFCIFWFKILCLATAIFGCFFTIRQFDKFPLLAAFSGYVSLLVTLLYTITYEKAFAVPKNMERLKTVFLLAARPKTNSKPTAKESLNLTNNQQDAVAVSWPEFEREIERIRNVGIKVGSFHHMEQMSTLNYIDFVSRNVVNLLVLFQR